LRACFAAASRVPCGIPEHIAASVLNQIERLPPGDGLCPDLHPANGIMTADDPRLIDWTASVRASGALDLARCHVSGSKFVYASEDVAPERPRALNAVAQCEYVRLAGTSLAALTVGGVLSAHHPNENPGGVLCSCTWVPLATKEVSQPDT